MLDPALVDRILLMTAASLLGWPYRQLKRAIAAGEVSVMTTPLGEWIWREELIAKVVEIWPLDLIEDAQGDDAERVLPPAIRTRELRARVPRYQVACSSTWQTRTVNAILTRELEDVAIPGFREAINWPSVSIKCSSPAEALRRGWHSFDLRSPQWDLGSH